MMIKTYITNKKYSIEISQVEDIDFEKIISDFKISKKTVRTEYKLPRIAFIGNFRTLSITCQREIAKNLGFEYIEDIPFGTFSPEQMQLLSNKWSDITKDFTKLIVIGQPIIVSLENNFIQLDYEAENQLLKTYQKDKIPVCTKYKIPIILESDIIRLHSKYPDIKNNTSWKNEPSLKHPKPICDKLSLYNNPKEIKERIDGIQFGFNCKFFVPQYFKCEKSSQTNLSEKRLIRREWVNINKAILYSKILGFDLIEKIEKHEIKVRCKNTKTTKHCKNKSNDSFVFYIEAAYDDDDCLLCEQGGSCQYFERHEGRQINCLMEKSVVDEHPNFKRFVTNKAEKETLIERLNKAMIQQSLF
jgi:hypothetical protein